MIERIGFCEKINVFEKINFENEIIMLFVLKIFSARLIIIIRVLTISIEQLS